MSSTGDKKKGPAVLRVKFKHRDLPTFVEKFAHNVSHGGLFLPSRQPKAVGTEVRFELLLATGESAIKGEGRVAWIKEFDPDEPRAAHGMGIKFTKLVGKSRDVLKRCLDWKTKHTGRRTEAEAGTEGLPVHTGLFDVPEAQSSTDEDADPVDEPVPAADPTAGAAHAESELATLLQETGLADTKLDDALAHLRNQLDGKASWGGELDGLLTRDAGAPPTLEDATSGLARLLGGEPVRPRASGLDGDDDEATELTPPPIRIPLSTEIDDLRAPLYGEEEAAPPPKPAPAPAPSRQPQAERPPIAASPDQPNTADGEEKTGPGSLAQELAQVLDAFESNQQPDTHVDVPIPQFVGRGLVSEVVLDDPAALVEGPAGEAVLDEADELKEALVQAGAPLREGTGGLLPDDAKSPVSSDKRRSSFFKKLFGK